MLLTSLPVPMVSDYCGGVGGVKPICGSTETVTSPAWGVRECPWRKMGPGGKPKGTLPIFNFLNNPCKRWYLVKTKGNLSTLRVGIVPRTQGHAAFEGKAHPIQARSGCLLNRGPFGFPVGFPLEPPPKKDTIQKHTSICRGKSHSCPPPSNA